jgi:hypothetical protein
MKREDMAKCKIPRGIEATRKRRQDIANGRKRAIRRETDGRDNNLAKT